MSFVVVIPARYASTRLPGKPLADIHGKPMVQHVVEKALQSGADRVIVATDDERVQQALESVGHAHEASQRIMRNLHPPILDAGLIAALEWTRRNIAHFGGDPGRTTISGCSAGGSAINALMGARRAPVYVLADGRRVKWDGTGATEVN